MLKQINNITKKRSLKKYDIIIKKIDKERELRLNNTKEELKEELLSFKDAKIDKSKIFSIISLLSESFFDLKPYPCQFKGALTLDDGIIAEMKTGEGKTLSAIIAMILNYIKGNNIHIVTANEYLVKRDYEYSKPLFQFLGIKSDYVRNNQTLEEKKECYNSDIIYSTSRGLVFDYLNNNKFIKEEDLLNERRDFIIADEVDFVLIDEARTPIILSGTAETDREMYLYLQEIQKDFNGSVKDSIEGHEDPDFFYTTEMLELTEKGYNKLENTLIKKGYINEKDGIYKGDGFKFIRNFERALKANYLFKKDIQYIINDNKIIIVNLQTGRPQEGRRFSDGLHQALEAKEGLEIHDEGQTLAQTTLQNYFRKYKKIAGMTGTALTEETEFKEFYGLKVFPIEPNKELRRIDGDDLLFLNKNAMIKSLLIDVKENVKRGQPTLIGVQSVKDSEFVAYNLQKNNINFEILDAKNHEKEAYVISRAGKFGSVTVATNMAGRGTDIMLGGNKTDEIDLYLENNPNATKEDALNNWIEQNKKVKQSGGLSIIGIGRSEAKRYDNQLIGRAGRQGDEGTTKYYLTLEDQMFENLQISFIKSKWNNSNQDQPMSAYIISKMINQTQKNNENLSFNMRKNLLKFDNINTNQREIFYNWRRKILLSKDIDEVIRVSFFEYLDDFLQNEINKNEFYNSNFEKIKEKLYKVLNINVDIDIIKNNSKDEFQKELMNILFNYYKNKMSSIDKKDVLEIEKRLMLKTMDLHWAENITNLEGMRMSTSLRAYAQKNPLEEYQKEALEMFDSLVLEVRKDFSYLLIKFSPLSTLENNENPSEKNRNVIDASKFKGLPSFVKGIGI